jgi:ribose transport system ATP-binding protein
VSKDLERALIDVRGIRKHYGGIRALDGVSLEVRAGEVHALVGENGAGKSTLVKVMTGAVQPDAGQIVVHGEELEHLTPEDARRRGIGAVYQEQSLVPGLTVLENVFLARELRGRGALRHRQMREQASAALERIGAQIRLGVDVATLSVAERQLVEIARALVHEARVIIFDEPSAILSGHELDRVFDVIEELRAGGLGILYISHRLAEIFRLADRATVLKDGQVVATRSVSDGLTTDELIRLMVGRDINERPKRKPPRASVVLAARDLQLRPGAPPVSFELRAGEVLGVAGLVGSGRSRLAQALGGIRPVKGGEVLRNGAPVKIKRPRDAVRAGIAVIPEDRKREGLILAHSIRENVGLASLDAIAVGGLVRGGAEKRLADAAVERFGIKTPSAERAAGTLSGGNQQKVVLGKWLVREPAPEVAVLDEPTRGVDVGAKYEIYRLIDRLVEAGAGVLLISSELPEVIAMSDRIMVMSGGYVVGTLEPEEFSEERILRLAVLGQELGDGGETAAIAAAELEQGAV